MNNFPGDSDGLGDCKLDPKPSAFSLFYEYDFLRTTIKDDWAKMINLKRANQVFDTTTFTIESGNLLPRIYIWNDALPSTSLKNVVILANFTLTAQNVIPNFPYTGSWYNLMDNSLLSVTSTTNPILLQPGEYRIYGNKTAAFLGTYESSPKNNDVSLELMQNPIANNIAKLRFNNAKGGIITIFDFSGKVIKTTKVNENDGEISITLNGIPVGTYLVQLRTEKGNATIKMINK